MYSCPRSPSLSRSHGTGRAPGQIRRRYGVLHLGPAAVEAAREAGSWSSGAARTGQTTTFNCKVMGRGSEVVRPPQVQGRVQGPFHRGCAAQILRTPSASYGLQSAKRGCACSGHGRGSGPLRRGRASRGDGLLQRPWRLADHLAEFFAACRSISEGSSLPVGL